VCDTESGKQDGGFRDKVTSFIPKPLTLKQFRKREKDQGGHGGGKFKIIGKYTPGLQCTQEK
jgi:hypothetical protein